MEVKPGDIVFAHRMGPKPDSQKEDRRSLVVKLVTQDTKRSLVRNSKTLKNNNFFVNELLTPRRNTICYVLRKIKKES